MNDDVQKYIYGTLTIFITGVLVWVGFIFINACGFSLACKQGAAVVERTPIPTLFPATMPALEIKSKPVLVSDKCRVAAADLMGAWVSANFPEEAAFQFVDVNGETCAATFAEVQPLFDEANLWHSGSLACVSCHSVDVSISPAQLDLSSYAGILAGSRRENAESKKKGTDILGGGIWKKSLLYEFLVVSKADIPGHTQSVSADSFVFVGKPFVESVSTQTPTATPKP
jgi:hypothetical protein